MAGNTADIFDIDDDGIQREFRPAYQALEPCQNLTAQTEEGLVNKLKACLKKIYL